MARVWKQIRPGTRLLIDDWPAGTLPSAESMQSVGFLNQFIGWMRYIGNFTWTDESHYPTWPDRETAKFLVGGENIQRASFWNAIGQFDATADADLTDNMWIDIARADIIDVPHDFTESLLSASSTYSDLLESAPIANKDNIHPTEAPDCFILNLLLRARTRMDMCQAVKVPHWSAMDYFILYDYQGAGGYTIFDDYRTVSESDSSFPNSSYKNTVHVIKFANWAGDPPIGSIQEMSLRKIAAKLSTSVAAPSAHDLVVASKGAILPDYTTYPSPEVYTENHVSRFYIQDLTEAPEEVDAVFGPLSSPSYITSGPFYADVANANNFYAVLLDELPEDFTAAGNAP